MALLTNLKNYPRGLTVGVGILVLVFLAGGFFFTRDKEIEIESSLFHRVLYVIDGDTLLVSIGGTSERVRLVGLDTPEVAGTGTRDECFGPEASDHLNIILTREEIRLERDSLSDNRDKFERLLRYVYLKDGTLVNEELVRGGWATVYRNVEFEKQDLFFELESQAQELGIGLWGACVRN